jgi:hypothetical protein
LRNVSIFSAKLGVGSVLGEASATGVGNGEGATIAGVAVGEVWPGVPLT